MPRVREIIQVSKNPKGASMEIYLKPQYRYDFKKAEEMVNEALKLDEISELIQGIFLALFFIIAITSIINGYGIFSFIYTIGLVLILFLPPILCITSGALIMVLRKFNHVEIDGDWGTMDLIVSVYSKIYSKED